MNSADLDAAVAVHCGNVQSTIRPWAHIPKCRHCKRAMA